VTSSLGGIAKHTGRLTLLACLADNEPLSISQLSAKTGLSRTAVRYHVRLLASFGLVEREGKQGGERRRR
jgi:predicted transcriptional regulator